MFNLKNYKHMNCPYCDGKAHVVVPGKLAYCEDCESPIYLDECEVEELHVEVNIRVTVEF